MQELLLYFLAKVLGAFFRLIPAEVALFVGRRLGEGSILFNKKRYRIAYANLRSVFSDRYSPKELRAILKRTYANIGQGLVEVFLLPKMDERYIKRYFEFEDFHLAEEAMKKGKGLIILTAHFGTWELSHVILPYKGLAFTAVAREQKPYLLNKLLNRYRESAGCKVITKGMGIKEVFRTLKARGVVGMLADQDAGKQGIFVKLFGREASWNRGVMEIAMRTGAPVIVGLSMRKRGPYVRFKLYKPIELPAEGEQEDVIRYGIRQYADILEQEIKQFPDHWLWQHRRWKSSPQKFVIILNDKRTGHLRQSEAVVNSIKEAWSEKGHSREDIKVKIIDIEFKNNLCFCLKDRSYEELIKSYADIIVSCGSSAAWANLIASRENNAKSIVIMKPALINLKKFNLAIIPQHDNPPNKKNVVVTDGALNLISRETVETNAQRLRSTIGALKNRVIGIMLGGNTKNFYMDKKSIDVMLDSALKACEKYDCDILLTTSRRTPQEVEGAIKTRLRNEPRCKLLVIANENNIDGAVEGIAGLSEILIASQESISMISEAASSGAYTVVFKQTRALDKRHNLFLEHLHKNGFIDIADTDSLYSRVSDVFEKNLKLKRLNDSAMIKDALEEIL